MLERVNMYLEELIDLEGLMGNSSFKFFLKLWLKSSKTILYSNVNFDGFKRNYKQNQNLE